MRLSHVIILLIALLTAAALIPPRAVLRGEQELLMVVWGMPFEDRLFVDGYARGFEELHPGWTVRYQRHASVADKYNAWHVQGRGADVMRMGIDYYHGFVDKTMLTPLSQFIHDPEVGLSAEEIADYFPAIWEQLLIDGEIYALPSDNAQYGLYYNKAIFDEHNRLQPDDPLDYPHAGWTWDDLRRAALRLTVRDSSGRTIRYGVMFDLWSWPFLAFFKQAGGRMWNADQTTTFINSPEGVEAMGFLISIVPPDAPVRAVGLADAAAGPAELFKHGQLAMLLDGSWRAPNIELEAPDLDFAVAPLPHHRERAVVSGSVLWAISIHSDQPRQAWEMIRWMTDREQSLRYWDTLRVAPPARVSVIQSEEFRMTRGIVTDDGIVRVPPMPAERYADRAAWLEYAITPDPLTGKAPGFVPASLYQIDLQELVTTALIRVLREGWPAKDALDAAAREVHRIIDRDRAAKGLSAVERSGG